MVPRHSRRHQGHKEDLIMARKVDITDKLSFEGNPSLVIKGKALEVNADAPTMLKVMGQVTTRVHRKSWTHMT